MFVKLLLFRNAVAKGHNTFEVTKSYIYVLGHVNLKETLSEGKLFWNMTVQYVSDPHIICVQFVCKRTGNILSARKPRTN